jgi:antirestriction protein
MGKFVTTEVKVWVGNLGKYNEGELVGDWFTLPADVEEIMEEIGINEEYEEYFIADYEAPIEISEYHNLEELNKLADFLQYHDDADVELFMELVENGYAEDFQEAWEMAENGEIILWHDCADMEDVAREYAEQTGLLDSIPDNLQNYFDFEAFGRDMEIEGSFHRLEEINGYFEVIN